MCRFVLFWLWYLLLAYYSDKHAALLILFWEIFPPTRLIFHIYKWKKSQNHVYLHSLLIKELRVSSLLKKLIITFLFKTLLFCFVFYSISDLRHQNTSNCGCKCVKRLCKTFCGQSACLSGLTQWGWSLSEDWFKFG